MLAEHGDAVEADLLRYGVDLLDLWRGRLSLRRVQTLVSNLPADSSTGRALHGDQARRSYSDHLLEMVFDVLMVANWQRQGDSKAPRPKPLSSAFAAGQPQGSKFGTGRFSIEEMKAILDRWHGKEAANGS